MYTYKLLASVSLGEWSEIVLERRGRRYYAQYRNRAYARTAGGMDTKDKLLKKADAMRMASDGNEHELKALFGR